MPYHKTLEKQIQKTLTPEHLNDPAIQHFLNMIDLSYKTFENDKKLTEQAFLICEKEYQDILHRLQMKNNIYQQSVKKLKDAILLLDPQAFLVIEKEQEYELSHIITYLEKQIQKRKEAEAQLLHAKEPAANMLPKNSFRELVSHEVRTPLNTIIGLAHLMMQSALPPGQQQNLKALYVSAENLLRLINDLLDFDKIEEGQLELAEQNIDLLQMANNVKMFHQAKASEKGNTIHLKIDPCLPHFVKGDEVRLGQVIHNLVTNAIKFTSNGSITIEISLQKMNNDEATVYFAITDTGIGIEKEHHHAIFNRFTQSNANGKRQTEGPGLGLTIVKRLLTLHNSDIYVKSEPGHGSVFYFTINFGLDLPDLHDIQSGNQQKALSGIKVLLVEDVEFNILVAQKIISNWHAQVDIAENGLMAIGKIKEQSYDIILMDLQMPVMDGFHATRHIRDFDVAIPIIALSASAAPDIVQRTRECGMNDFLAKPFKPAELFDMISKYATLHPDHQTIPGKVNARR